MGSGEHAMTCTLRHRLLCRLGRHRFWTYRLQMSDELPAYVTTIDQCEHCGHIGYAVAAVYHCNR
jgi:hypothetical protein